MNRLYRIENNQRVYTGDVSIENIFYSELYAHFLDYLNNNSKIYYIQCESNHNFSLSKNDLTYLNTLGLRRQEKINFVFSENIKNIKHSQRIDLFFLTDFKNIDFLILIPKLDKNNKYYFNLVIGINNNFNINMFYNLNLKTVNIKNISELNFLNLNESVLENIFDFLKNNFRDNSINRDEFLLYKNCLVNSGSVDSIFTTKGRRIYKKIIFKHISYHFYWDENKFLKPNNDVFWVDWGYKDQIVLPDNNKMLELIEMYHPSNLIDVMVWSPEYLCFTSWNIKK